MSDMRKKVLEFFKNNPNPPDKKVHAFAESIGMNEHKFEEEIYKVLSSFAAGGKSVKEPAASYNKSEVESGTRVEAEHTTSPAMAERITKDHLAEIPDYYKRLLKMEDNAKAEGSIAKKASMQKSAFTLIELIAAASGVAAGAAAGAGAIHLYKKKKERDLEALKNQPKPVVQDGKLETPMAKNAGILNPNNVLVKAYNFMSSAPGSLIRGLKAKNALKDLGGDIKRYAGEAKYKAPYSQARLDNHRKLYRAMEAERAAREAARKVAKEQTRKIVIKTAATALINNMVSKSISGAFKKDPIDEGIKHDDAQLNKLKEPPKPPEAKFKMKLANIPIPGVYYNPNGQAKPKPPKLPSVKVPGSKLPSFNDMKKTIPIGPSDLGTTKMSSLDLRAIFENSFIETLGKLNTDD